MAIDEEQRQRIIGLARRKDGRIQDFSYDRPADWRPRDVLSKHGFAFTGDGAWEFIADLLESGCDVNEMVLRHPPGATGYELVTKVSEEDPEIYIKIELVGSKVMGRSFHYSYKG